MARTSTHSYTLFASAARDASVAGDAVDVSHSKDLVVVLRCTVKTGSPTSLDVKLQGSYDGTNFFDFKTALAFTQITAANGECLQIANLGAKFIRAYATIVGGTPTTATFTFSVYAHGKS